MKSHRKQSLQFLLFCVLLSLLMPQPLAAQIRTQPRQEMHRNTGLGFELAPEVKFSTIGGKSARFTGLRAGIILDHKLTLGAGGYVKTTDYLGHGLNYGGFFGEYLVASRESFGFAVGGLLGGGTAHERWFLASWRENRIFSVVEPQAKFLVSGGKWFRLGLGGGYRFVSGGEEYHTSLSGPTFTISLAFGRF